ncbi:MAG: hypothetical protein IPK79_04305 [Vampirovibrionales bacterium]|nr:hypothetical protein [Vampirovibrionales bacterium]
MNTLGPALTAASGVHDWGARLFALNDAIMRSANEAWKADTPEKIAALGAQDKWLGVQRAHADVMLEAHCALDEYNEERRRKSRDMEASRAMMSFDGDG